jgi:hypothetical protein
MALKSQNNPFLLILFVHNSPCTLAGFHLTTRMFPFTTTRPRLQGDTHPRPCPNKDYIRNLLPKLIHKIDSRNNRRGSHTVGQVEVSDVLDDVRGRVRVVVTTLAFLDVVAVSMLQTKVKTLSSKLVYHI